MQSAKKSPDKSAEKSPDKNPIGSSSNKTATTNKHVYFIGGGLASLAGAVYLIRDCNFDGDHIHILEAMPIVGGSNDGAGNTKTGFVCRGGRMLNEETYENFWELFRSIPSLNNPDQSVTDEILSFDHAHPTCAKARLIDKNGKILNARSMGFNQCDRMQMLKLLLTPEKKLDHVSIEQWFKKTPHFFETNFWHMWQTTFAFQKWSSAFELRRYMNRMILEFSRIETLEGVTRTPLNQFDSVILPLQKFLAKKGVHFRLNCSVTDLDFKESTTSETITVTGIHWTNEVLRINEEDLVIITNGCMTDNATLGDYQTAPVMNSAPPMSYTLWKNISVKKPGLGNPDSFFCKPEQTNWESFTVTFKNNLFLKQIENFTGNKPGSGALMTFKDSSWKMSMVVAAQPHFKEQTENETIFWGYGLYTNVPGDHIKKPMRDCTGEEIFTELLFHLKMLNQESEIKKDILNVIPCMMPYIISMFQPRAMSDRPEVVPKGSTNFAMISQFVEIPNDMVFTEEYSVRAARLAIYKLMGVNKQVCPVTRYDRRLSVMLAAIKTAYR